MLINNFVCSASAERLTLSAMVVWEDRDFPSQQLTFEIGPTQNFGSLIDDLIPPVSAVADRDAMPNAFLAACFPLAAVHGEARVKIEGDTPCAMLVEGLRTAYGWWSSWGGMPKQMPIIETRRCGRVGDAGAPRRAASFLSGGVDGLHMLMRNHQLYRPDDPAYIREAIFIHGFDIGKRARDPENDRFRTALRHLAPVAAEAEIRLVRCRTNLRHLPTKPDFWTYRYNGSALAAVGHAALYGPAFLFIAASHHLSTPVPMGSHPAVDHLLSSQRIHIIHDGTRFTRLEKVRELASWPTGLRALRVCPEGSNGQANCGRCEKCLRTRLELLVVGVEETEALGPSLTPLEQWDEAVPTPSGHRAIMYEHLLPALRARGLHALSQALEHRIDIYRRRIAEQCGETVAESPVHTSQSIFA
jgi:hypothetical protein